MTGTAAQSDMPVLPGQLCERITQLGMTVLSVSADGCARPCGSCRWIERVIVASPLFATVLRRTWDELFDQPGRLIDVWPGVSLVALPMRRRRRSMAGPSREGVAALVLSPELIDAEELRLVCDAGQLDYHATVSRIDPRYLIGRAEAQRLAMTLQWMSDDASQIDRRLTELESMSQELSESYEELSLLYKLSSNMTVNQPARAFLTDACHELQQVVQVRWMALYLVDDPRLEQLRGQVFRAGPIACDDAALARNAEQLLAQIKESGQPIIVDDMSRPGLAGFDRLASNLMVVPLRSESQQLGVLLGGDKLDGSHISSVDTKLCNSLANSLAIFLDNRMLYDDMQAMFLGTLHALTSAIDAKDSYTHGHSERVALMSRLLAEALGLDKDTCERIYIAGLVHDVGKIGVPETVLCKPGRLTAAEFDLIKMHPEIGARILQDIRQMSDLLPGVLYHHERWDGRGYPHGLAGMDIPLFGRVIGLADAFDAMSSDRTYRQGMPREAVLAEIRSCSGSQFDPSMTDVFIELNFDPYDQMIDAHRGGLSHRSA